MVVTSVIIAVSMLPKGSGNLEDIATIMIPRSVRRQTMVLNVATQPKK